MIKYNSNFLIKILIIFFILIFDQSTKYFVINFFKNQNENLYLTSFLNIHLIWNNGIAFGLFNFNSDLFYNIVTMIISVILIIIFVILVKTKNFNSYFYALIIGGGLGNLIDRIHYSSVPDFIDFHIANLHWFVFNIADIFVSIGVFCLIIVEIFFKDTFYEKN